MRCTCTPSDKSALPELYAGSIDKFGVEVGVTSEVTAAAGGGANTLLDGNARNFTLQLFSTTQRAGLNFALGVASLKLRPLAG